MIRQAEDGLRWTLAGLLAVVVATAPWPFGGVAPWALASLEAASFVALALALVVARQRSELAPVAGGAICLAAVALLGTLQSLTWPASFVAVLSREHLELFAAAKRLTGAEAGAGAPLSVAPGTSRAVAWIWAAAAAFLAAGCVAGRSRRRRRLLAAALTAGALFTALYGARLWFAGASAIWGVEVPTDLERLRSTFVNPNHFATFLAIVLPLLFAGIWWGVRRASFTQRIERRLLYVAPALILWATLFVALAFSKSRSGLAAVIVATLVQTLLVARGGRSWRPLAIGGGVLLAGAVALASTSLGDGLARWLSRASLEVSWLGRVRTYAATLELWQRFPWTGSGLGTFRDAFPMVQPAEVAGSWWHAHNDPLELLATAGVVGVVLLGVAVWSVGRRLLAVLVHGRRSEDRAAGLAAIGAAVGVGLQELVDFGLTQPANAFLLAIVVGAACGAGTDGEARVRHPRLAILSAADENRVDDA